MNVIISPNIKHERVRIDPAGNIIDPKTKQIIQENKPDYVPKPEDMQAQPKPKEEPLVVIPKISIQQQIEQAEKHLADLKLAKQEEIARMKKQLEELEKS